jgi:hypothetical protein
MPASATESRCEREESGLTTDSDPSRAGTAATEGEILAHWQSAMMNAVTDEWIRSRPFKGVTSEGCLYVIPEWIGLAGVDGERQLDASEPMRAISRVELTESFDGLYSTKVVLHLKSDEAAYFLVSHERLPSLRAAIASVLSAACVPVEIGKLQ